MLPIRCFTCNFIIGQFTFLVGETDVKKYEENNIQRICCRKTIKNSVDIHQNVAPKIKLNNIEMKYILEDKRIVIPR